MFPVGTAPGQKWEVEFTAGVWTDVSADVEYTMTSPPQTHYGRTSQYSQPGPGSETLWLRNPFGKYTPQRQVLTNGQAHPFWPNVVPRKRIRRSYTVGGVTYYRFWGYIKGFPPSLFSGIQPIVSITATTRDDQLSRVKMLSPIHEQIGQAGTFNAPNLWWPLTDDAGSTQAVNAAQGGGYRLGLAGSGGALTFGADGPGAGDGTGVNFAPSGGSTGQWLEGTLPILDWSDYTFECWVNAGASLPSWAIGTGTEQILSLWGASSGLLTGLYLLNGVPAWVDDTASITGATSIVDAGWHHLAVTRVSSTHVVTLYVDGVSVGTTTSTLAVVPTRVRVGLVGGGVLAAGNLFQGNIGEVALYTHQFHVYQHAAATNGYSGDTTDARAARYLSRALVASSEMTLDAGQTTVGTYPQNGKDVISACQDMATTEGGVFWFRWDGQARLANRRYRDSTTPVLTLDASVPALLDPDVWDPAYDETTLVNVATAARASESGTLSTQTYTDTVSFNTYNESDAPDLTTYTLSDQDALNLAQAQVAGNSQPGFRLEQLAVNFHAATSSLYTQLAAIEIGSRIRIINVPTAAAPFGTLDLFVEGWTETPTPTSYRVVFDTSPVVAERIKLNDATYGKLGCAGQTLNAALTNSATTAVIATSGTNPTFTTVAGMYPMNIKIGEEIITLPSAPGGAASPQTFTNCLRGQQGTFPAAQAAGSVVTLWPRTGLAL